MPFFNINNNAPNLRAVMEILDVRNINVSLCIDGPDFIEVLWDDDYLGTLIKGYSGGWNKGIPHTEETKEKISKALKGKIPFNKGIPHTEETKKKISKANEGKTSYWKGKNIPKDAINKMKKTIQGTRFGENNSNSKSYKITFDNGDSIVVKSLQTWAVQNGYKPTSLRNLYNGRQSSPHKNVIKVSLEFV